MKDNRNEFQTEEGIIDFPILSVREDGFRVGVRYSTSGRNGILLATYDARLVDDKYLVSSYSEHFGEGLKVEVADRDSVLSFIHTNSKNLVADLFLNDLWGKGQDAS